jgi:hypothetical protein
MERDNIAEPRRDFQEGSMLQPKANKSFWPFCQRQQMHLFCTVHSAPKMLIQIPQESLRQGLQKLELKISYWRLPL